MVADTPQVRAILVSEQLAAAEQIQSELARRFANDDAIGQALTRAYGKRAHDLTFAEVADALASFIRHEFRVRPTELEEFVFEDGPITARELAGGILFYGRVWGNAPAAMVAPISPILNFMRSHFPRRVLGRTASG
jgi:cytochrome c peroxidase